MNSACRTSLKFPVTEVVGHAGKTLGKGTCEGQFGPPLELPPPELPPPLYWAKMLVEKIRTSNVEQEIDLGR